MNVTDLYLGRPLSVYFSGVVNETIFPFQISVERHALW